MHSLEQTVAYGNTVSAVSTPVREGYTFDAWQVNGANYDFTTPVTGDIELVATWAKNTYTVYFVSQGSVVCQESYDAGAAIEVPTIAAREGYILKGWCTDEALTRQFNFVGSSAQGDLVLYANWVDAQAGDPDSGDPDSGGSDSGDSDGSDKGGSGSGGSDSGDTSGSSGDAGNNAATGNGSQGTTTLVATGDATPWYGFALAAGISALLALLAACALRRTKG